LAIYSPEGGQRVIRLPHQANVVDLLDGHTLAKQVTELPLTFGPNTTRLLGIEVDTKANSRQ